MKERCDSSDSKVGRLVSPSEIALDLAAQKAMADKASEAAPKRSNEKPAGPIEEAEQDAKDPTHEKEVNPKTK